MVKLSTGIAFCFYTSKGIITMHPDRRNAEHIYRPTIRLYPNTWLFVSPMLPVMATLSIVKKSVSLFCLKENGKLCILIRGCNIVCCSPNLSLQITQTLG